MKRIFASISTVLMVGALAVGATGAFFSDTEVSANNIFTAGSIDLKIDHSLSTYNGNNQDQSLVVVSDPTATFVEDDAFGAAVGNAVNLIFVHPAWQTIPGANWIWATQGPNHPADPNNNEAYVFTKTFVWNGPVTSASLQFGADNYYDVSVNGNVVGSNHSLIVDNFQQPHTTDVTAFIVQGVNTITFRGENQHVDGSNAAGNPAGIIFRLEIDGQQTFVDPVDLTGQTFWNFNDVKPNDQGRDDFSLHVDTNDAWTCLMVGNIRNEENDLIDPEADAGDVTPGPGVTTGELGAYLQLFLWHDTNQDGVFNPPGETVLGGGTGIFTNLFVGAGTSSIAIHDSLFSGTPQAAGSTDYVGSAWCAGTIAVDGLGNITCDGASVSNQAQTDSTQADLGFYAEQYRNNPNFVCSSLDTKND